MPSQFNVNVDPDAVTKLLANLKLLPFVTVKIPLNLNVIVLPENPVATIDVMLVVPVIKYDDGLSANLGKVMLDADAILGELYPVIYVVLPPAV